MMEKKKKIDQNFDKGRAPFVVRIAFLSCVRSLEGPTVGGIVVWNAFFVYTYYATIRRNIAGNNPLKARPD